MYLSPFRTSMAMQWPLIICERSYVVFGISIGIFKLVALKTLFLDPLNRRSLKKGCEMLRW